MNSDMIEGNWEELKGKVRETWGKLTDDDLTTIGGRRDQLIGRIQQRYGRSTQDIMHEIARFEGSFRTSELPRRVGD